MKRSNYLRKAETLRVAEGRAASADASEFTFLTWDAYENCQAAVTQAGEAVEVGLSELDALKARGKSDDMLPVEVAALMAQLERCTKILRRRVIALSELMYEVATT